MWKLPLAVGCVLIGSLFAGLTSLQAEEQPCAGAAVTLTPEHFQRPTCIFVRSQECPQSPGTNCPNCNFLYEYYGPDGLYHPIDGEAAFRILPEKVPVLILVHGSFVDFVDEPDLLKTYEWIRDEAPDKPLLVLCYRWPSTIGCKVVLGSFAVCELAQRAEFNGFYLAQLINRIPDSNSVRLMGHSHGCRMIASAMHLLSGGKVDGTALNPTAWSNRAFRVTFFSAAMDHDWFNPRQKYEFAIHRMCWLQNHRHSCDWALLTYPLRYPGSSRALGQAGFTKKDLRLLGSQAAKIEQFDDNRDQGIRWCGHSLETYLQDLRIKPVILNNIFSEVPELPSQVIEELLPPPRRLIPIPEVFSPAPE